MSEPISLSDYNVEFFFFFVDFTGNPMPLDPRIGKFRIQTLETSFNEANQLLYKETNHEVHEVDFFERNDTILTLYNN